jgi:hypothetical protein
MTYTWTARVRGQDPHQTTVYTRNHAFVVGPAASFRPADPQPSAVEYLLGALGADLAWGFQAEAARQAMAVEALELVLTGHLGNPLVFLGVIGETGNPGVAGIQGVLYVSTEADPQLVRTVWATTLARSPLYNTLKPGVALDLELRLIP